MSSPSSRSLDGAPLTRTPSRGSQGSTTPGTSARGSARTVLGDKYQLGEELGRGAFGQVFKGLDQRTGNTVAIKQMALSGISPEGLHSVMGEIELLKNLNHRNIVKYIGSFKTRSHLYIILEYMENGALSSHIKPSKFGNFPESLVAVYIQQVLQGLAYLHEQGVVHRDIKGANILTTKEGIVKLADFGVAAKLDEERDKQSVVGTPYWMAPEVVEMTGLSAASDIWSVGALAIELLTGSPPYGDLHPMSALYKIVQDDGPPMPPDISSDMRNFLVACFQKDPSRRPGARDLLAHRWVQYNRATLRTSWSRTKGLKARGVAPTHDTARSDTARSPSRKNSRDGSIGDTARAPYTAPSGSSPLKRDDKPMPVNGAESNSFGGAPSEGQPEDVNRLLDTLAWQDMAANGASQRRRNNLPDDAAEVHRCGAFWLCCARPPSTKKSKASTERRDRRQ
ncbi:hypothetical protein WJX73_000155 [Symbiochloris irregularis]|uniref:non-specific serine/threonine protein kinase n=1 Tax=Symbiochloris irregularis TaxID=706552 RepID=A0AAW1P8X3_9CHLO